MATGTENFRKCPYCDMRLTIEKNKWGDENKYIIFCDNPDCVMVVRSKKTYDSPDECLVCLLT